MRSLKRVVILAFILWVLLLLISACGNKPQQQIQQVQIEQDTIIGSKEPIVPIKKHRKVKKRPLFFW